MSAEDQPQQEILSQDQASLDRLHAIAQDRVALQEYIKTLDPITDQAAIRTLMWYRQSDIASRAILKTRGFGQYYRNAVAEIFRSGDVPRSVGICAISVMSDQVDVYNDDIVAGFRSEELFMLRSATKAVELTPQPFEGELITGFNRCNELQIERNFDDGIDAEVVAAIACLAGKNYGSLPDLVSTVIDSNNMGAQWNFLLDARYAEELTEPNEKLRAFLLAQIAQEKETIVTSAAAELMIRLYPHFTKELHRYMTEPDTPAGIHWYLLSYLYPVDGTSTAYLIAHLEDLYRGEEFIAQLYQADSNAFMAKIRQLQSQGKNDIATELLKESGTL